MNFIFKAFEEKFEYYGQTEKQGKFETQIRKSGIGNLTFIQFIIKLLELEFYLS